MNLTLGSFARLAADHVWQSTVFAAAIWLLTLLFRRHRAAIRHGLWVAASIKFIVPFAVLIALGQSVGWTRAPLPAPQVRLAVDVAAQPFSPLPSAISLAKSASSVSLDNPWLEPTVERGILLAAGCIWILGAFALLLRWTLRWRNLRQLVASGTPIFDGREVEILERLASRRDAGGRSEDLLLQIVAVDSTIEPGVVGVFRPVLLWPATISGRLSDEQIAAIFTHELAHVQRRDNVWAAVHMAVESICWFHPLVWWMRARLLDERERACDEAVLRGGRAPQPYAESILRTCEFYLESPLPCVTGVTGADLKRRIETIMRNRPAEALGRARTVLLSVCAFAAIAAPIGVGIMRGPRLLAAQANSGAHFDTVSIKRNTSGAQGGTNRNEPGRYVATNISLRMLIRNAYGLLDSQIVSGPALATAEYFSAEKFDIVATIAGQVTRDQRAEMMRNMLADRFNVIAHTEMREMPVYVLARVRADTLGSALKPAEDPQCSSPTAQAERQAARQGGPPAGRGQGPNCGALMFGPGEYTARSAPIGQLAASLTNQPVITGVDRIVLDRTGLADRYDFQLRWRMPRPPAGALPPGVTPPPIDPDRPDLFQALREQLGLKLEPQRAPIEVLIVDSAAMPTEN